ncbi:hypothetical protein ACILE2_06165 [Capnocytophaga canimorsus]|uniref:hypothetical protein n=1 Tax=Capnocytophaga canimorsus TaxID=28188 RepID=UPI0037D48452
MKKIFSLQIISILFIAITTITSCSRDKNEPNNTKQLLSDEQIAKIGILHNEYLEKVFSDFDWNNQNLILELKDKFNELSDKKVLGIKIETNHINKIQKDYVTEADNDIKLKNFLGDNYSYIQRIKDLEKDLFLMKNEDVNPIINSIIKQAKNEIKDAKQLTVILVFAEVFKKSNEFWTSKDANFTSGQNILAKAKQKNIYRKSPSKGEKILAADATGAAGALIGGALFANADAVIAPPVFFGRVAFSAAWASGVAALF